jgi:hypothetical protein
VPLDTLADMGGRLVPCGRCSRHVRSVERSCPFCGSALALSEPVEELRWLTPLDRLRMASLGAVLSAAGFALGCREPPVVTNPSPVAPVDVAPSTPPSVVAPPAPVYGAPPHPVVVAPSSSASSRSPSPPKLAPTTRAPTEPPGAPVAAYGAPPPPKLEGP